MEKRGLYKKDPALAKASQAPDLTKAPKPAAKKVAAKKAAPAKGAKAKKKA